MPFKTGRKLVKTMFQSAPLVAEGRCLLGASIPAGLQWFQSAPLVAEGRCLVLGASILLGR